MVFKAEIFLDDDAALPVEFHSICDIKLRPADARCPQHGGGANSFGTDLHTIFVYVGDATLRPNLDAKILQVARHLGTLALQSA